MGPLSSLSQRIAVAYAFSFIPEQQYLDLELIRKARNYFAHHPMDATLPRQRWCNSPRSSHRLSIAPKGNIPSPGSVGGRCTCWVAAGLPAGTCIKQISRSTHPAIDLKACYSVTVPGRSETFQAYLASPSGRDQNSQHHSDLKYGQQTRQ
jgi:hypothetical protein